MNKFWRWVKNKAPDSGGSDEEERALYLNGAISDTSWFDDDVTPAIFKECREGQHHGLDQLTGW